MFFLGREIMETKLLCTYTRMCHLDLFSYVMAKVVGKMVGNHDALWQQRGVAGISQINS